ncbi:MAG: MBL fold metallo-hydrolase [Proteobacteria bacterium]|nr:MBL fold metallo-hydrolase [Pseudomonadota bacterium]
MMLLEFIAHATFVITLHDGRRILIDPYQGMSFQGRFNYPAFQTSADFVLITHEHLDHCYLGDISNIPVVVRHQWHDHGLSVHSVFAWHDRFGGTKFGGGVQMKIIEAEGLRIAHLGDVGEDLSDTQIKALGKLDVLILPIGGFYTIDGDAAASLVQRLQVRTVIPCHYKTTLCDLPIEGPERFLTHFKTQITCLNQNSMLLGTQPEGIVVMRDKWHIHAPALCTA